MFNDLNQPQNNRQPIDDIFAETDKPSNNSGGNIETHRVGLTAPNTAADAGANAANEGASVVFPEEAGNQKPKLSLFKISAIIIVAAILILSGYLVYSKFFKAAPAVVVKEPVTNTVKDQNTNTNSVVETNSIVTPATQPTTTDQTYVSEIPGLASTTASSTPVVTSTLDSDNDGLTDAEEAIYGTNPLMVDTDNDGLSDYEEVKIYHTNPLVADTDGDGYLDGAEVKSGYDPNVKGAKLANPISPLPTAPTSTSIK